MSGPASIWSICAPVPDSIADPPAGSRLHTVLDAMERDAAKEPVTDWWLRQFARKLADAEQPAGWRPETPDQAAAHELLALQYEAAVRDILAEADGMDYGWQREALSAPVVACVYMTCGGQSGSPGAHEQACQRSAELLGIPSRDIAAHIPKFFEALGRNGLEDARTGGRAAYLKRIIAALDAVRGMLRPHWHLLDHSHERARQAAENAASFDARYQPCAEDIEYARS